MEPVESMIFEISPGGFAKRGFYARSMAHPSAMWFAARRLGLKVASFQDVRVAPSFLPRKEAAAGSGTTAWES